MTTNKTPEEAVRGFGQAPTNYAIETGIDKVAAAVGIDPLEVRRRNFIRADQFPYLIPSGTTYDSGDYHGLLDKVVACRLRRRRRRARRAARTGDAGGDRRGLLPGALGRQLVLRAAAEPEEHHHHLDGILPHPGRCARRGDGDHAHDLLRPGA